MKTKLHQLAEWMRENKCANFVTVSHKNESLKNTCEFMLAKYLEFLEDGNVVHMDGDDYLNFKIAFVIKTAENL